MSKRLLIITCHRLSDNNGGANGSKGFIYSFASLFDDCSLIYPEFDNPKDLIPSNVKLFPCHDSRLKIQKGLDMYRGVVNALYSCVRCHLKNHQYDIIVIDHSVTGTGIIKTLKKTGAKIITIHHNVERDYLKDNSKERPITFRYPYNYFAKKAERNCLRLSDVNLTVTESDAEEFRSWDENVKQTVYNLGNCEYRPIPDKIFRDAKKGNTFIITGSLCFVQSLKPILNFVQRYYPIIQSESPNCRLIIAGRNPSDILIALCNSSKSIKLIPNPTDMSKVVMQADYYICPIDTGSGFKLRALDGLKQGLPILANEVSSRGYEDIAKAGCLFSYSDERTFRESLKRILECQKSRQDVYQAYRNRFALESGKERLRVILEKENIL